LSVGSTGGPQQNPPWKRESETRLLLFVRLTPKSGADKIEGGARLADGSAVLKIRVRAVPEDGKANRALLELLSKSLGVPLAALSLKSGSTARIKTILIEASAKPVEAKLLALI